MTSRMVENQRRAFIAQAEDAARRLQDALANLSDAQRAAIIARLAEKTSTPIDIVYWADESDADLIAEIVDRHLRIGDDPNTYLLGSGCLFQVVPQPGSEHSYE
jgi:hypothetical protein